MTTLPRLLTLLALAASAGAQATFTPLNVAFFPSDLSGDGATVVGTLNPSGAWRWTAAGGAVSIGGVSANAVSRDGSVVVGNIDVGGLQVAGRWTQATGWVSLGALPGAVPSAGVLSTALGVSGDGAVVCGTSRTPAGLRHAFRWTAATGMLELTPSGAAESEAWAVSSDGQRITGWEATAGATPRPAVWTVGAGGPLVFAPAGIGRALSDDGSVVAGEANQTAFRWSSATGLQLLTTPPPPPKISGARDVSRDGRTVVGTDGDLFGRSAFLWRTDLGPTRVLRDLLVSLGATGLSGWTLEYALSIADDGRTILGRGSWSGGPTVGAFLAVLPPEPVRYCTAKTNSLGCVPRIESGGFPSAALTAGFEVACALVRNGKPGLLFYGTTGRASAPFQGGTLCVAAPVRRTPARGSGGAPPPAQDCSGRFAIDLSAFAAGLAGGNPAPELRTPGHVVDAQWWGRDQGFPAPLNTTLSDGLEYVVLP